MSPENYIGLLIPCYRGDSGDWLVVIKNQISVFPFMSRTKVNIRHRY